MRYKNRFQQILMLSADIFLLLMAIIAIVYGVVEFFSDAETIPLERSLAIIAGLMGLIIVAILIDRRIELAGIRKLLEIDDDFEYIADTHDVVRELTKLVSEAEEFIFSIGAKSTAKEYLDEIETKVKKKVQYRRLLTGDHITPELYRHLSKIIEISDSDVNIAWNKSEKYGLMTITENGVIIALPSPYKQKFTGIKLVGDHNARLYNHYFMEAFSKSTEILTKDGVTCLLDGGEYGTARDDNKIAKFLHKETERLNDS